MKDIKEFINEYRLEVNGVKFWVPYPYENLTLNQRREYSGKEPKLPPFKGRGTPAEIQSRLQEELEKTEADLKTPEEFRHFMASLSLGVECSGFAYYVLNEYLKTNYGKELKNHLYRSREYLLDIYDHPNLTPPKGLERSTVENYPNWVSLAKIQEDWGNNPRYVVDAPTFTNEGSTVPVKINEIKPANLIQMMGHDGIGHPLVIAGVEGKKIIYAHSAGRHGRKNNLGGVEYGEIKIIDPKLPIEKQDWKDAFLLKTHKFETEALRRLKILAE